VSWPTKINYLDAIEIAGDVGKAERIVPGTAEDRVGAGATDQDVVAHAVSENRKCVVAAAADERIVAAGAGKRLVGIGARTFDVDHQGRVRNDKSVIGLDT